METELELWWLLCHYMVARVFSVAFCGGFKSLDQLSLLMSFKTCMTFFLIFILYTRRKVSQIWNDMRK